MHTDAIPDVLVLIPGILGSVLQREEKDVWALSGGAIGRALATGWDSIQRLAIKRDSNNNDLSDDVVAARLINDVHLIPWLWKIDGYTRIRRALTTSFADVKTGLNYFEFPYDWRLDNRIAARQLQRDCTKWLGARRKTAGNEKARLILICHSMGGLVARYFLEVLGGWRDTAALLTFGTPYRGSLNALDFIANGMRKKMGPIPIIDLSNLLRSFTSVYQLLPIYPCHDEGKGMVYLRDAKRIPYLDPVRVQQALDFHNEIRNAVDANLKDPDYDYQKSRYFIHPIVGTRQPTLQSSRYTNQIQFLTSYQDADMDGDGTVPRVSATPIEIEKDKRETFISEAHGSLQNAAPVWTQVESIIRNAHVDLGIFKADRDLAPQAVDVGLAMDDLYEKDEPIRPRARPASPGVQLTATLSDVNGISSLAVPMKEGQDGWHQAEFPPQAEGVYRMRITGFAGVLPVQDVFAVGA